MKKSFSISSILFVALILISFASKSQDYNYDFDSGDNPLFHSSLGGLNGTLRLIGNSYTETYSISGCAAINATYRIRNQNDDGDRSDAHIIISFTNSQGSTTQLYNGTSASNGIWYVQSTNQLTTLESGTLSVQLIEYADGSAAYFDYLNLSIDAIVDNPSQIYDADLRMSGNSCTGVNNLYLDADEINSGETIYWEEKNGSNWSNKQTNGTTFSVSKMTPGKQYRARITTTCGEMTTNIITAPSEFNVTYPSDIYINEEHDGGLVKNACSGTTPALVANIQGSYSSSVAVSYIWRAPGGAQIGTGATFTGTVSQNGLYTLEAVASHPTCGTQSKYEYFTINILPEPVYDAQLRISGNECIGVNNIYLDGDEIGPHETVYWDEQNGSNWTLIQTGGITLDDSQMTPGKSYRARVATTCNEVITNTLMAPSEFNVTFPGDIYINEEHDGGLVKDACAGTTPNLVANIQGSYSSSVAVSYIWRAPGGAQIGTGATFTGTVSQNGLYTLEAVASHPTCGTQSKYEYFTINILPEPVYDAQLRISGNECIGVNNIYLDGDEIGAHETVYWDEQNGSNWTLIQTGGTTLDDSQMTPGKSYRARVATTCNEVITNTLMAPSEFNVTFPGDIYINEEHDGGLVKDACAGTTPNLVANILGSFSPSVAVSYIWRAPGGTQIGTGATFTGTVDQSGLFSLEVVATHPTCGSQSVFENFTINLLPEPSYSSDLSLIGSSCQGVGGLRIDEEEIEAYETVYWDEFLNGFWVEQQVGGMNFDVANMSPGNLYRARIATSCDEIITNELQAPDIFSVIYPSSLFINNQLQGNTNQTIQYSKDLELNASLDIEEGFSVSYQWTNPTGSVISSNDKLNISAVEDGIYSLQATVNHFLCGDQILTHDFEISFVDQNLVFTYTAQEPITSDLKNRTPDEVIASSKVYDGLGRETKLISHDATSSLEDLIVINSYNSFGTLDKRYLPFPGSFDSGTITDQQAYYNSRFGVNDGQYAFEKVNYDQSPKNRISEEVSPGYDWRQENGKTRRFQYLTNSDTDYIKDLSIDPTSDLIIIGDASTSSLNKTTMIDEDESILEEYINGFEQVTLKRAHINASDVADTYYIYDFFGRLRYVLQPEGTNVLNDSNDWSLINDSDFQSKWMFSYSYDSRGNLTAKKVPGAEEIKMVYDNWNRLVLTQEGNQRIKDEWSFTKYDALNRVILTGIVSGVDEATARSSVGAEANHHESFDANETLQYTNTTFPVTGISHYLTATYYDDYNYQSHADWVNAGIAFSNPGGLVQHSAVKGQVTGTMTKVDNGTWVYTASYYDAKYRLIQSQSTNHLGGVEVFSNYYDFAGRLTRSINSHNNASETINRSFEYDHAGRLLQTWHRLNTEDSVLIVENNYNELGELVEKDLHDGRQSVDYEYNVRGWLTKINESDLTNSLDGDLFGMELFYNNPDNDIANETLFNGNISGVKWSTFNDHLSNVVTERGYRYGYDKLNRLVSALPDRKWGSGWTQVNQNRVNYAYDLNGNINSLDRRDVSAAFIDQLSYTYVGNQLQSVSDAADSLGFYDGNTAGDDYDYDANGNMVVDKNKSIDSIYYNHLNLPILVDFETDGDSIEYLYDAAGIKLRQMVYDSGILVKKTDYIGEFIYENGDLQLIQHEEGRVVPSLEKAASDVVWHFNVDKEAFWANSSITNFQQASPGHLEGTISGSNPIITSPNTLSLDANQYDKVKIRLENNTTSDTGWLFFKTTMQTSWTSTHFKSIPIQPNSGYTEYVVDMSDVSTWDGTITQLRIDPVRNVTSGDFKIDWVRIDASYIKIFDYQYHLKDHLSNTRLTFSTKPENYIMLETFEDGGGNGFEDLHITTKSNRNTTQPYTSNNKVEALSSGMTGAMLLLSLNKGDTIDLEVNASYTDNQVSNTFLGTAYSALFSSFDGVFGGVEGVQSTSSVFDDALSGVNMAGKSNTSTAPRAFLNYIIFDGDMNYVSAGFDQISTAGHTSGPNTYDVLSVNDIIADEDGYILTYLSNENQEFIEVYFDDFTVYHGKTNVVQADDYYPFGLTFNGYQRTASTVNRFKYNEGVERVEDFGLNWDMAIYRISDPEIGRWLQIDPIEKHHESGYAWVTNNPILYMDYTGLDTVRADEGQINIDDVVQLDDVVIEGEDQSEEARKEFEALPSIMSMRETQAFMNRPLASGAIEPFFFVPNPIEIGISVVDNTYRGEYIMAGAALIAIAPGGKIVSWSSKVVSKAAKAIENGATIVKVTNRSEAEELFLGLFQAKGYKNTTGMSAVEAKRFHGTKAGTYHWDDIVDETGRLVNHGPNNVHGASKHLQIHDFDGKIIRINFD